MTQSTIELRVLTPSEGMVLYNGETYSTMVYLGVNASPDDWWEVPEEEMVEKENEANSET